MSELISRFARVGQSLFPRAGCLRFL